MKLIRKFCIIIIKIQAQNTLEGKYVVHNTKERTDDTVEWTESKTTAWRRTDSDGDRLCLPTFKSKLAHDDDNEPEQHTTEWNGNKLSAKVLTPTATIPIELEDDEYILSNNRPSENIIWTQSSQIMCYYLCKFSAFMSKLFLKTEISIIY